MSTFCRILTKPALTSLTLIWMELKSYSAVAPAFIFTSNQFLNFTMLGRVWTNVWFLDEFLRRWNNNSFAKLRLKMWSKWDRFSCWVVRVWLLGHRWRFLQYQVVFPRWLDRAWFWSGILKMLLNCFTNDFLKLLDWDPDSLSLWLSAFWRWQYIFLRGRQLPNLRFKLR